MIYWLIIIGMFLVTYLPRVLPFYLIDPEKVPTRVKKFLNNIPYAMLGVMIFPGFLGGIEGERLISGLAFFAGSLVCYLFGGTMLPIMVSIAAAALLLWKF